MTPAARWFVSSLYLSHSLCSPAMSRSQLAVCKHIYVGFLSPGNHGINLFSGLRMIFRLVIRRKELELKANKQVFNTFIHLILANIKPHETGMQNWLNHENCVIVQKH